MCLLKFYIIFSTVKISFYYFNSHTSILTTVYNLWYINFKNALYKGKYSAIRLQKSKCWLKKAYATLTAILKCS